MSDSPESVVREFLAAWGEPSAENLIRFFNEDAVWVDGPQGIRHGATEIADVLAGQLGVASDQTVEIDALVANDGLVLVEWHGGFTFNGKPITTAVMAVFEVDANGRINQWREKYDLKSVTDQMAP